MLGYLFDEHTVYIAFRGAEG